MIMNDELKRIWNADVGILGCNAVQFLEPRFAFLLSYCMDGFGPASPHSVTSKKTNIDIFTTVRTSNLIQDLAYFKV
jgi:hypothetical protein